MIGTLKIRVHAAAPQLPLQPCYTFVGSPSSIRVVDVPRTIGSWAITAVHVTFSYPDNSIVTANCVQTSGVWVGTIAACAASGSVSGAGVTISADGTDENGDAVTGYVLGKGDLYVLAADATIVSDGVRYNLHLCEDEPETPQIGDVHNFNGTFMYYNGTQWVGFGTGVTSINGMNGAVTLTGANIAVSGSDATKLDAALAAKANASALSGYLPLSGGRVDGELDAKYLYVDDEIGVGDMDSSDYIVISKTGIQLANDQGEALLPSSGGTLALTSDIPTIDSALSSSSTNPVQNKAVTGALSGITAADIVEFLGKTVFGTYKGEWNNATAYSIGDIVLYEGKYYRSIENLSAGNPDPITYGLSWGQDSGISPYPYTESAGVMKLLALFSASGTAGQFNALLASLLAQYLPKSGGTMTGDLTIDDNNGTGKLALGNENVSPGKTTLDPDMVTYGNGTVTATWDTIINAANGNSTDYAKPAQLAVTPWSASTAYAVGVIVAYNGATYRCTTAHTSGSAWDSTKWTADAVAVNSQIPTVPTNVSAFTNDSGFVTRYSQSAVTVAAGTTALTFSDRTANRYDITALTTETVAVTLPTITSGKVADVVVTLVVGADVPTFDWDTTTNTFIASDSDWATLTASKVNVLTFTSTGVANEWIVGRITEA